MIEQVEIARTQSIARPAWKRALGRALKWGHSLRWRAMPPDYSRTYRLRAAGFDITVLPTVFHPKWHFTSIFFAESCVNMVVRGSRVLEIGTGTGLVALAAARKAGRVVATDINPAAVECARLNARQNGMAARVDVREGDMFEPVVGERFDVILCNPPYFRGTPRSDVEYAYKAGENLEWISRLAREACGHLEPAGCLACVFGDAADVPTLVSLIEQEGWRGRVVSRRDILLEELTVWQFRPA
jgi:release factor glutamine methyltransferase